MSSLILAASSHYFRRMLDSSDWQESSSKERPIEVTLCQEGK